MAIKTLRKFWKKATSNPLYALGAIGLGGALWKEFDAPSFDSTMGFLDMAPTQTRVPTGLQPYTTGLPGSAPGYRGGWTTKSTPATDLFGKTQGLFYDIQKGLGQTIATPLKLGALFSSDGEGYNYLFGKGTWGQFKSGLQGTLPKFLTSSGAKVGDVGWGEAWKAYRAAERFRGGAGGDGGGGSQQIQARRSSRISGSYQQPSYRSSKYQAYDPSRLSANLLRTAYKDKNLSWLDRSARGVNRIGPNINFRTSIKVGGKYTRTRT